MRIIYITYLIVFSILIFVLTAKYRSVMIDRYAELDSQMEMLSE